MNASSIWAWAPVTAKRQVGATRSIIASGSATRSSRWSVKAGASPSMIRGIIGLVTRRSGLSVMVDPAVGEDVPGLAHPAPGAKPRAPLSVPARRARNSG